MDGRFSDIIELSGCIMVGLTSELNENLCIIDIVHSEINALEIQSPDIE